MWYDILIVDKTTSIARYESVSLWPLNYLSCNIEISTCISIFCWTQIPVGSFGCPDAFLKCLCVTFYWLYRSTAFSLVITKAKFLVTRSSTKIFFWRNVVSIVAEVLVIVGVMVMVTVAAVVVLQQWCRHAAIDGNATMWGW